MPSELATFAGGCFWCIQQAFEGLPGVVKSACGYTGGSHPAPAYDIVCGGKSGHREAVRLEFDPAAVSYEQLLETFWHNIDPTQREGQFADRGNQYATAIYYHNEDQRRAAEESKERLASSGKFKSPIVTEVLPAAEFFEAEEEHQFYYRKNAAHYTLYKIGSGRAGYIKNMWGG